jgi:queuine/archaeosine tRNA-ribosyltransferase
MGTSELTSLTTRSGVISFPAYVPVTTFGAKYPLDELIQPYLPRLASAVMVSYYYARQMKRRLRLPMMIDSGGFASLFEGASLRKAGERFVLEHPVGETTEVLEPGEVLEFQEQYADVAFTLDFPIPPKMAKREATKRLDATIANAIWAIRNTRRRDLPLYASVQGWDVDSYRACARAYKGEPFAGLAIGGLVPRAADHGLLLDIVDAVRFEAPDLPIHAFGMGHPGVVKALFERGIQSVDSSSYVKAAADGRMWCEPARRLHDASPVERLHLALSNLASATRVAVPLPVATLMTTSMHLPARPASL